VRAGGVPRLAGLDLNRLNQGDLVDVEDLLHPPDPPRRAIVVTAVLALMTLIVAVVGIGTPSRDESVRGSRVTIAGQKVASGDRVAVDLSHDVPVTINDDALAARTDQVVLRVSTLGIPLGDADAPAINGRATIDPGKMKLVAAGKVTGEIELKSKGETLTTDQFPFRAKNAWYLTAMGIGSLLVLLVAFANVESSLRPLSRGKQRKRSLVGAGIWGAVIGGAFVALSASLSITEMTYPTIVIAALFGAAAGVMSCYAAIGLGRRRKLRRALKRAEKRVSQRATAV
jgi:hypothetical protein